MQLPASATVSHPPVRRRLHTPLSSGAIIHPLLSPFHSLLLLPLLLTLTTVQPAHLMPSSNSEAAPVAQPAIEAQAASHAGCLHSGAVHSEYGSPSSVLSMDVSRPTVPPGPSEVQIRVVCAGMNPADVRIVEGDFRSFMPLTFPHVAGFDCSGVVTAVGSQVVRDDLRVGQSVYACCAFAIGGAFQQFVCVDESLVSVKPSSMSFAEAAAVPVAGSTALTALLQGGVKAGSRVVVIGAAGGCGTFAVQMAKALGASLVVGVTSAANAEYVRSLGADQTIDSHGPITSPLSTRHPLKDIDVIFDAMGTGSRLTAC